MSKTLKKNSERRGENRYVRENIIPNIKYDSSLILSKVVGFFIIKHFMALFVKIIEKNKLVNILKVLEEICG